VRIRKYIWTAAVALLMLWLAGPVPASAVTPAEGAHLVLEPGQTIAAEFPCEPLNGGLTVLQTADFVNEWQVAPFGLSSSEGTCTGTLYQFPPPDRGRHTYSWRTRQCLYVGNCSNEKAHYGPIWTFTVEPPSSSVPTPPPTVPAAPGSPAHPSTPAFTDYVGCGLTPSTRPAHHCSAKSKKGAFFKSQKSNVIYSVCIKFPGGRRLCAGDQSAERGTLYVNTITANRPGHYEATWSVEGSVVGVYAFQVAAARRH
jgi:hypothetical protein